MKRKRFTEEQIIAILKEAEPGVPTKDLCRKHGMASPTFYKWRRKYAGMEVNEAKRLRQLEDENRRLKKLVADLAGARQSDAQVGKRKKVVSPAARRELRSISNRSSTSATARMQGAQLGLCASFAVLCPLEVASDLSPRFHVGDSSSHDGFTPTSRRRFVVGLHLCAVDASMACLAGANPVTWWRLS